MIFLFMNNGGMGNQMFQYAVARRLQIEYGAKIICDLSKFSYRGSDATKRAYCLDQFDLSSDIIYKKAFIAKVIFKIKNRILFERLKNKTNDEKYLELTKAGIFMPIGYYNFYQESKTNKKHLYISGLFQAHEYFDEILTELRKDFSLKSEPNSEIKKLLEKIKTQNSVCVHWRRGDYLSEKWRDSLFVCDESYYDRAMDRIGERIKEPVFYIFTNSEEDAHYIQNNHHFPYPVKYINLMLKEKHTDIDDFRLMTVCRHFIISNSTFSWWAQYLSSNPEKIVCAPSVWNKKVKVVDFYQKEWEIISV